MSNTISQVQSRNLRTLTENWILTSLGALGHEPDVLPHKTKRRYPGEVEGEYLVAYLEYLSAFPAEQKALIKMLRSRKAAFTEFESAIQGNNWAYNVQRDGLVILPTMPDGVAALAVLLLDVKDCLGRLRKCLHCGKWFYGRFPPQKFCRDRNSNCRWNHFHTPEWRKQHREQNRKHQRNFRERWVEKRSK